MSGKQPNAAVLQSPPPPERRFCVRSAPRLAKALSSLIRGFLLLIRRNTRAFLFIFVFVILSLAILFAGLFIALFRDSTSSTKEMARNGAVLREGASVQRPGTVSRPLGGRMQNKSIPASIEEQREVRNQDKSHLASERVGLGKSQPEGHSQHRRGVLMSCPVGQSQTHRGPWKPKKMILGVEAVIKQLESFKSKLPLLFGYYESEMMSADVWCKNASRGFEGSVQVICFKIPERYPKGLYGYAKIFAIKHAPAEEVLWLDCDAFPVRPLDSLFADKEFRRTGAMFWPDSRDFFDETRAISAVKSSTAKSIFPLTAWYVRQGFDSGLLLLNRKSCAKMIDAMCEIARTRSGKLRRFRTLSMGDKDIFHVVWMMHGRNFTLVPYIGESGNVQTVLSTVKRRSRRGRRVLRPGSTGWMLSSQVKYGRDGRAYVLHQLHAQSSYAIVATLGDQGDAFHVPGMQQASRYVKPFVVVMEDLRIGGGGGDFVTRIENALIQKPGGEGTEIADGMIIKRGPEWVKTAAARMSVEWNRISQYVPTRKPRRSNLRLMRRTKMPGRHQRRVRTLEAVKMRSFTSRVAGELHPVVRSRHTRNVSVET